MRASATTTFTVTPALPGPRDLVTVAATVTNIGDRPGEEVVQLYLRDLVASVARPVRELRGFARVALAPGGAARVTFAVAVPQQPAFLDTDMRWVVEPGDVSVMVGASSADVASGGFSITGERTAVAEHRRFSTAVRVEPAGVARERP